MMRRVLSSEIANLYSRYSYIYDTLKGNEKKLFDDIISCDPENRELGRSLRNLSKFLSDYHDRECIVLIDEYDHPLEAAYHHNYYEEAVGFFAVLFGALLKVNISIMFLIRIAT